MNRDIREAFLKTVSSLKSGFGETEKPIVKKNMFPEYLAWLNKRKVTVSVLEVSSTNLLNVKDLNNLTFLMINTGDKILKIRLKFISSRRMCEKVIFIILQYCTKLRVFDTFADYFHEGWKGMKIQTFHAINNRFYFSHEFNAAKNNLDAHHHYTPLTGVKWHMHQYYDSFLSKCCIDAQPNVDSGVKAICK